MASCLRMHGSAQSAGNITHLSRGTAFAAGLFRRTGTKTSLDLPIPFLFPISQRAVPSQPTMTKMIVMPASMSQTAPGPCLTPWSCLLTPQPTDRCPQCWRERARLRGRLASTKMSLYQKGIVRKVWAWKLRRWGPRPCWSPASSVACGQEMEISYTDVRLTCWPAFLARGGCTSSTLLVQDVGRSFRKLLRYSSFKKIHALIYTHMYTHTHLSGFRNSNITIFDLRVACTLVHILLCTQTTCALKRTQMHSVELALYCMSYFASPCLWNTRLSCWTKRESQANIYLFIWRSDGCRLTELHFGWRHFFFPWLHFHTLAYFSWMCHLKKTCLSPVRFKF